MIFACDLCESTDWKRLPLKNARDIGVCQRCGLVYVRERRSAAEIAADWGNLYGRGYDPDRWPAVRARLHFVAAWISHEYGFPRGHMPSTLLDIGAGTGTFIYLLKGAYVDAKGIEPSKAGEGKVDITVASVEDAPDLGKFDFVTINWALENCANPIAMLRYARQCCRRDGKVIVATGSRINVPYKKALSYYLGNNAPDLHATRWSHGTLPAAFNKAALRFDKMNRYYEQDWLVMSAVPDEEVRLELPYDDPEKVAAYFQEWERAFP